ncbi:hypothetical protein Tsubulata_049280, partial [Turnera subulata]
MWLSKAAVTAAGCFGSRGSMLSNNTVQQIKPVTRIMPAAAPVASIHASPPDYISEWDRKWPIPLPYLPESLEHGGNLADGITLAKHSYPPTWSLDEESGRRKISRDWGIWVPPSDADIHKFFYDMEYRHIVRPSYRAIFTPPYRQVLIPYFQEIRNSWVSSYPDYRLLEIIRPAHEVFGGSPDDYTTAIQPPSEHLTASRGEMESGKWQVGLAFLSAVQYLNAITGDKHEAVEVPRRRDSLISNLHREKYVHWRHPDFPSYPVS